MEDMKITKGRGRSRNT